ncbi:MAG: hypothetical protein ACLUTR_01010 [Ruminococcus bicirculans (ex Wegman et al. 2014)]|uniref:hypothetical protein n=1 Tax=Ruminococcus bicirculans (ex Wegman et al. 2014) TaxID=1160721 RepID=UPI00399A72D6
MEKVRAEWAIEALQKAAEIKISVAGAEDEDNFLKKLRKLAEEIWQHNGLDESVMDSYDAETQKAKEGDKVLDTELNSGDIENLMQATFDLCESLETAEKITPRLRLMHGVMYLWKPLG